MHEKNLACSISILVSMVLWLCGEGPWSIVCTAIPGKSESVTDAGEGHLVVASAAARWHAGDHAWENRVSEGVGMRICGYVSM